MGEAPRLPARLHSAVGKPSVGQHQFGRSEPRRGAAEDEAGPLQHPDVPESDQAQEIRADPKVVFSFVELPWFPSDS